MPRQLLRLAALVAAAMALFAGPARAQSSQDPDSGWFDDTRSAGSASAAPASAEPNAAEMQSIPPSPLLQDRSRAEPDPADSDPRALDAFRPTLDPYGRWVQDPTYGLIWIPDPAYVGTSFAPYVSSGRWALDDDGEWIWVSDYPFGGVVFHYGRWVWIGGSGWAWIPGYRYAPAWVTWRVPTGSYAYIGWAPLGPDFIWVNGAAVSVWWGVPTPWVFCPSVYVFSPRVHYHIVRDRAFLPRLAASSRRYDGRAYYSGRAYAGDRRYTGAAPRVPASPRARTLSGPPLSVARVPAQAVPRQRVRPTPLVPASNRVAQPGRIEAQRSGSRFESRRAYQPRAEPSDGPRERSREYRSNRPDRASPARQPDRLRPSPSPAPQRISPTPRLPRGGGREITPRAAPRSRR